MIRKQVALKYADTVTIQGVGYRVIVQNRINPKTLIKIPKEMTDVAGEYWVSADESDVRPYGFCALKI